jgi:hypothetical protein
MHKIRTPMFVFCGHLDTAAQLCQILVAIRKARCCPLIVYSDGRLPGLHHVDDVHRFLKGTGFISSGWDSYYSCHFD